MTRRGLGVSPASCTVTVLFYVIANAAAMEEASLIFATSA